MPSIARLVVVPAALVSLLSACGGDDQSPAERAQDDGCDARDDLRDAISDVADDLSDGDLASAADGLDDVTESANALSSSLGELTEAQRAEVQPHIDAIQQAIG